VRRIVLKAAAPGTAELQLKHWREWEGDRSITAVCHFLLVVTANQPQEG
jgi:hypothetical protein